jgi:hypothetical protein
VFSFLFSSACQAFLSNSQMILKGKGQGRKKKKNHHHRHPRNDKWRRVANRWRARLPIHNHLFLVMYGSYS